MHESLYRLHNGSNIPRAKSGNVRNIAGGRSK